MNHLLKSLTVLTIAFGINPAVATAQAMQKGISVELPVASNAIPMPFADKEDALIVTITENGSLYFGIDLTTPSALKDEIRSGLPNRADRSLYIKADAHSPYANVQEVIDSARASGIDSLILLTAQTESSKPGAIVSPKGFLVQIGGSISSFSVPTTVRVLDSGGRFPDLMFNREHVSWTTQRRSFTSLFQNLPDGQRVLITADGLLPFAQIVHVIEMCIVSGREIALIQPGQ